jgi:glutaredoxin
MTKATSVILYTRAGCHLCDDAHKLLTQHGLRPMCVDIDRDQQLRDRFDTCVPVVEIDGKIRFRGRVEPRLLGRLLRHCERQQADKHASSISPRINDASR